METMLNLKLGAYHKKKFISATFKMVFFAMKRISRNAVVIAISFSFILLTECVSEKEDNLEVATVAENRKGDFFQNSRRRVADPSDIESIAKFMPPIGCAAFFVANQDNRPLVVSAQHCNHFDLQSWCENGGSIKSLKTEKVTKCRRIIAGDNQHDIVLFEVDLTDNVPPGLTLTSYLPSPGTRLKMIGFPVDPTAENKAVVTENCWLKMNDGGTDEDHDGNRDKKGRHNCTTYSGNSGGPMLIEGISEVIGLPSRYTKDDFNNRSPDTDNLCYVDLMFDFVTTHLTELVDARVVISAMQPTRGIPSGQYFPVGRYINERDPDCTFYVKPIYNSGTELTGLYIKYEGSCSGNRTLSCQAGICQPDDHAYVIKNIGESSFDYIIDDQAISFRIDL